MINNLELGLWHLQFVGRRRTLWIDTPWIIQKDIPEENHQVVLWEIYLDAEAVMVWLGEQGNAQSAINLCR